MQSQQPSPFTWILTTKILNNPLSCLPPCRELFSDIFQQLSELFNTKLLDLGNTTVTPKLLVSLLIWLTLIFFTIGVVKRVLKRHLLAGIDANNREAIATLVSYAVGVIAIFVAIQYTGINLSSLGIILGGLRCWYWFWPATHCR